MEHNAFTWEHWGQLDGLALAEHIRRRDVHPREVALQAATAIAKVDAGLGCALEIFHDVVEMPDREGSSPDGALYGVPTLLKDLGARLQGRVQESGSALFRGEVAAWTDPFIARVLQSGLVPIGRSTTAELGLAWDTSTVHLGAPKISRNPFDTSRTPGGSSGGSAALVAAGAVPIATSSDGGGSTRIPASHCGLIGLKPTRGLCPRPLDSSEYISRISTDGVVTRSVRDTAAVLDYTASVSAGGSFMRVASQSGSYLSQLQAAPRRLRVAWSDGHWGRDTPPVSGLAERVQSVVALAQDLGHELVDIPDDDIAPWDALWDSYTTNWLSARGQLAWVAEQRGLPADALRSLLSPIVYRMFEASFEYDKRDLWNMMALNNRVTRHYGALFERIDVLITPTYAAAVPAANGTSSTLHDGDVHAWFARQLDAARYAILGNEVGAPALSLPCGVGADGMPIGVQLCGRWGDESSLLQLAAAIEQARPEWRAPAPHIHVSTAF
jgi:amidase